MTNDTEARVRDALQALADRGGSPDETAAWQRIAGAIDGDRRSSGRRRALLAVAGLAVAGSAAAGVVAVALADRDTQQSVRVVAPAEPPATDRTPPTEPPAVVPTPVVEPELPELPEGPQPTPASGPVPAHPLAVVVSNAAGEDVGIALYDADTGEHLGTPVGRTIFGYSSLSVAPDGTLWFQEGGGDSYWVSSVAWGSTTKETPFGTETGSPAVSPDGTTIAYVHAGITVERPSVRIVDLASGELVRELFWRDDDPDWFHTRGWIGPVEWSPDGSRLLMVSSYEGSEVLVLDPAAADSLSDATQLVPAAAPDASWAGTDRVVVLDDCCYPEHERQEVQVHDLATGQVTVPEVPGVARAVDGRADGVVAVLTEDGVLWLSDGRTIDLPGATEFAF